MIKFYDLHPFREPTNPRGAALGGGETLKLRMKARYRFFNFVSASGFIQSPAPPPLRTSWKEGESSCAEIVEKWKKEDEDGMARCS